MAGAIDAKTCPRCGVKARFDIPGDSHPWAGGHAVLAVCNGCMGPVFAESEPGPQRDWQIVYPSLDTLAPEGCPDEVRDYFEEALSCRNTGNFRAAVLVARSALQACMRDQGAKVGSLQAEIDDLAARHIIPESLKAWAHEVRAGGNLAAHPKPGSEIQREDAEELIGLAASLFEYLYAIPKRIADRKAGIATSQPPQATRGVPPTPRPAMRFPTS
jgi:hypothetical protein